MIITTGFGFKNSGLKEKNKLIENAGISRNHNFVNTVWKILIKIDTCRTRNRHIHMLITTGSNFKNSGLKKNNEIEENAGKW
jgi:hypothetical protein